MRANRLAVLAAAAAGIVAVAVYYQLTLEKVQRSSAIRQAEDQQAAQALRRQVEDLTRLHDELTRAQELGRQALASEQTDMAAVQEKLERAGKENKKLQADIEAGRRAKEELLAGLNKNAEVSSSLEREKAALIGELDALRKNFDLVQSVRLRIDEIERSLGGLGLKPGTEDLVRLQLDQMLAQLRNTNDYLLLIRDAKAPLALSGVQQRSGAAAFASLDEELDIRGQVRSLKDQLESLSRDNALIKEKYRAAEEMLGKAQGEAGSRDERIFILQQKLIETENELAAKRDAYAALEKGSVELREKYVASELEKETMRVRLFQTSAELDDLRKKFVALLGRIAGLFNQSGAASGDERGRIGVELLPGQEQP